MAKLTKRTVDATTHREQKPEEVPTDASRYDPQGLTERLLAPVLGSEVQA